MQSTLSNLDSQPQICITIIGSRVERVAVVAPDERSEQSIARAWNVIKPLVREMDSRLRAALANQQ